MNTDDALVDSLAAAARTAGIEDVEAQSGLWRLVFGLDRWFFLPRGEGDAVQPVVVELDARPVVLAFTSGLRATEAAIARGLAEEGTDVHVLGMPPSSFLGALRGYASAGVFGIFFNEGANGFVAPLENLRSIGDFVAQKGAEGE